MSTAGIQFPSSRKILYGKLKELLERSVIPRTGSDLFTNEKSANPSTRLKKRIRVSYLVELAGHYTSKGLKEVYKIQNIENGNYKISCRPSLPRLLYSSF